MIRLIPSFLALLFAAYPTFSWAQDPADCTTIASCQARLSAQSIDSLRLVGGSFNNHQGLSVPLPTGMAAAQFDIGSLGQSFATLTGTAPVALPIKLPKQDAPGPAAGWTLTMFGVPTSDNAGVQGLVSFAVPAAQGGETVLSMGLDNSRGLLLRYGNDDWVTFWDPPQNILQSISSNGYYLALRFRDDGKLLVDILLRNNAALTPNCADAASCYRYSVLLDYGWPMPKFPEGKNAKTYYPITQVLLGAKEASKPAIQEFYIFSGPVTENMLQTMVIAHGTISGQNFINSSLGSNNSACNSGDIYFQPAGAPNLPSLCGSRPTEFATPIVYTQSPVGILNVDIHGIESALSSSGTLVSFPPYTGTFQPNQLWSVIDFDKRARNYKFKDNLGNFLVNDNDTLSLSKLDSGGPEYWWHLDVSTGYFRSVAGGLTLTSDHNTGSATLQNVGLGDSQYMQFKQSGPLTSNNPPTSIDPSTSVKTTISADERDYIAP